MAPKSLVLAALLIVLVAGAGQVPRCSGLTAAASVNSSVLVSGIVPCSAGTSINVATAPVFPNAAVQLVCSGTVVASTTADVNGAFLFSLLNANTNLITAVVANQCKVVVVTPLAACDKSLASATGTLTAPLKLLSIDTGSSSSSSGSGLDLGGVVSGIGGLVGGIAGIVGQIVGGLVGGILNVGTQSFSLV